MKKLAGKITISRVQSNADKYLPIRLNLEDDQSRCRVLEISMELADFANALTGTGYVTCQVEYYDAPLGKMLETKDETVVVNWEKYGYSMRDEARKYCKKVLKPYEVDGWMGSIQDLQNHHHWGAEKNGKMPIRVGFHRYVDPPAVRKADDPTGGTNGNT